jgi:hypothetical protein
MKITHTRDYAEARRSEYPDIGDQLDALWSFVVMQKNLPPDTKKILDEITATKIKYPKQPQK